MREQTAVDTRVAEAFRSAERIVMLENGQETRLVVLAVVDVDGQDYAMVVRENELGTDGAGAPFLFRYDTDGSGEAILSPIADDDVYADVLHVCLDLIDGDLDDGAAA